MHRQSEDNPIGHTVSPIVTGSSVIALKCREGVIVATDTLLSYGGLLSISLLIQSTMVSIVSSRSLATLLELPLVSSQISRKQLVNSRR